MVAHREGGFALIPLVWSDFWVNRNRFALFWLVSAYSGLLQLFLGLSVFLQRTTLQIVIYQKLIKNELYVRFYFKVVQMLFKSVVTLMDYKAGQMLLQSGESFLYYKMGQLVLKSRVGITKLGDFF